MSIRANTAPVPLEAVEQKYLFFWAKMQEAVMPELSMLFAVPNGGSRHKLEAANLKVQGVKSGVPDMFLPVARGGYHGLFIELKRRKGGRVSDEQRQWIENLQKQGYAACVCRGWQEAAGLIEKYLRGATSWIENV